HQTEWDAHELQLVTSHTARERERERDAARRGDHQLTRYGPLPVRWSSCRPSTTSNAAHRTVASAVEYATCATINRCHFNHYQLLSLKAAAAADIDLLLWNPNRFLTLEAV